MAHKIHPVAFRLGVNRGWDTLGWTLRDYPNLVKTQLEVRTYLERVWRQGQSGSGRNLLQFAPGKLRIWSAIYQDRPNAPTGGSPYNPSLPSSPRAAPARWILQHALHHRDPNSLPWARAWMNRAVHPSGRPQGRAWLTGNDAQTGSLFQVSRGQLLRDSQLSHLEDVLQRALKLPVRLQIWRGAAPGQSAHWLCEQVISALEQQRSWRWIQHQFLRPALLVPGVLGVRCQCSGRLQGAELARREVWKGGRTPLQSLHTAVDYASGTAYTNYGTLGVKVWIGYRRSSGPKKEKLPHVDA